MKKLFSDKTPVYAGEEVLPHLQEELKSYHKIFFLADFRTMRKCLPYIESLVQEGMECHTLVIQEGERFKNINTCLLLWKQLQQLNATRKDVLVNVGGGVVCDIGAFVAGTYKRGLDFIHVPTSLMAMADAALGGKCGVDLEGIKNQIGLFSVPKSVYIYPPFLETLDQRQLLNGSAEIIKHSLISDAALWKEILKSNAVPASEEYILKSAELKCNVINEDYFEGGKRKILNFGHTIGHALETYSLIHDSYPLLHGEAVAAGMICEAWISTQVCNLPASDFNDISGFLLRFFPKYIIPANAIRELIALMHQDKKNSDDRISFSLLEAPGKCNFNQYFDEQLIVTSFNIYSDLKA